MQDHGACLPEPYAPGICEAHGYTLSPAGPEDIEQIYALNRALVDQFEDLAIIDYPQVLRWIRKNIERTLPYFQKILVNGERAGYFSLVPAEKGLELDSFFLLPAFQGRGIGTQVLSQYVLSRGCPVFLYVFRGNTRAISLYEKVGFQVTKEVGTTRLIMEYTPE